VSSFRSQITIYRRTKSILKGVLITGAGSGLGKGTAIGLAKAGHRVFATTHIWEQATDLPRESQELGLGDKPTVDKLDVLDERDIKLALRWPFDTFVSNAAIGESGPISEIPVDLVRRPFDAHPLGNQCVQALRIDWAR
jgi:NAD(P)-dependent dehydrogenase (short-subunit alcohol dehydrogenase family)